MWGASLFVILGVVHIVSWLYVRKHHPQGELYKRLKISPWILGAVCFLGLFLGIISGLGALGLKGVALGMSVTVATIFGLLGVGWFWSVGLPALSTYALGRFK